MPVSRSLLQATNPLAELAVMTVENAPRTTELTTLQDKAWQPARLLAFSPDGSMLAGSTLDSLTIWDVTRQRKLLERKMTALHLTYSPDGKSLLVTGKDIVFLDAQSGEQKTMLKGHRDGTTGIAFSPDGALLASGGMDGMVRVGNLSTRALVRSFEHPSPVRGLAFSPDGETVASVAWGSAPAPRMIYLWNVRTGRQLAAIKCQTEKNLAFSPSGLLLAVDGVVYTVPDMQVRHNLGERVAAFSPNGKLIATCRSDFNTIGLWDALTGDKLALLKGHSEGVWSVAFNPAGTLLASSSGKIDMRSMLEGDAAPPIGDKSVRLWGILQKDPDETKPLLPVTKALKRLGNN